jgi:carbon monoxide dehydrogenase subunit G
MSTSSDTLGLSVTPGERSRARRVFVIMVWIVCLAIRVAASELPEPQVSVREDNGVYVVAATFGVVQPQATAVAVLTDYEQIPRFMPDVRTSRVVERGDGMTIVEQEAVARLMMFSKHIYLLLEIREEPGTIRFRDRGGKSFDSYDGTWTIVERDGQTTVGYQLTAKPAFDVPQFLLKRLLKRDATEMIERLQAEIRRR